MILFPHTTPNIHELVIHKRGDHAVVIIHPIDDHVTLQLTEDQNPASVASWWGNGKFLETHDALFIFQV